MRVLLIVPLAALAVAGCGGSSATTSTTTTSSPTTASAAATTATPAAASGAQTVSIASYKFSPATLTVVRGTRVRWTNRDAAPHTATASGLDTGTLRQGQSKTLTLSKPGTYAYVCQFHPYMHGTVVVR